MPLEKQHLTVPGINLKSYFAFTCDNYSVPDLVDAVAKLMEPVKELYDHVLTKNIAC